VYWCVFRYYNKIPEAGYFLKKRCLFWLTVLEVQRPGASSGEACLLTESQDDAESHMAGDRSMHVSVLINPLGVNDGDSTLMT
jgi:hypothetical protein